MSRPQRGSPLTQRRLLECFVVFAVPPTGKLEPQIVLSHVNSEVNFSQVRKFCFPFRSASNAGLQRQEFTFVLTNEMGEMAYGHCLQKEPATPASTAYCFCVVSKQAWFGFFESILWAADALYLRTETRPMLEALLHSVEACELLTPEQLIYPEGHSITCQAETKTFTFSMPDSSRLPLAAEPLLLRSVCRTLSPQNILALFAHVLHERRILLTSSSLRKVSCAAHFLNAAVFPFKWHHIFIPVVPEHLIDYASATIPYIMGIHSSLLPSVRALPLEEHVLVDLDGDCIMYQTAAQPSPMGDELTMRGDVSLVPSDLGSSVKKALKRAQTVSNAETVQNVAEAFTTVFAACLHGYRHFLRPDDREADYDQEALVQIKPNRLQPLVRAVTHSQMFAQFVRDANDCSTDSDISGPLGPVRSSPTSVALGGRSLSSPTPFLRRRTVLAFDAILEKMSSPSARGAASKMGVSMVRFRHIVRKNTRRPSRDRPLTTVSDGGVISSLPDASGHRLGDTKPRSASSVTVLLHRPSTPERRRNRPARNLSPPIMESRRPRSEALNSQSDSGEVNDADGGVRRSGMRDGPRPASFDASSSSSSSAQQQSATWAASAPSTGDESRLRVARPHAAYRNSAGHASPRTLDRRRKRFSSKTEDSTDAERDDTRAKAENGGAVTLKVPPRPVRPRPPPRPQSYQRPSQHASATSNGTAGQLPSRSGPDNGSAPSSSQQHGDIVLPQPPPRQRRPSDDQRVASPWDPQLAAGSPALSPRRHFAKTNPFAQSSDDSSA